MLRNTKLLIDDRVEVLFYAILIIGALNGFIQLAYAIINFLITITR